tara:strand:- start:128 stop:379 length:252 start_codon:yes stop_codon:yes gene_type:complete
MNDWAAMTRRFLLGEGNGRPSLRSYIQSLSEIIKSSNPKTQTEIRRREIAIDHIREIKRQTRKLEEKVLMLEEKLKVLEEGQK